MTAQGRRFEALDGLRGISILLVLFGHAVPHGYQLPFLLAPFFDGGLGVRVFFVISGFIITFLLLDEKEAHGKICWRAFVFKRLTKLFPSLALYVGVVWLFSKITFVGCAPDSYLISLFFLTEILTTGCWSLGHTCISEAKTEVLGPAPTPP